MAASALVILAAGSSSRLGEPKQLVIHRGMPLIQHTIDAAVGSGFEEIILILGFRSEEIIGELNLNRARVITNQGWQEGMASSIRCGLEACLSPDLEQLCICVGDQPYVTSTLLNDLLENAPSASRYQDGRLGVPAVFTGPYFNELMNLEGDSGARGIIRTRQAEFLALDFPLGDVDIDSPTDLDHLE